MSEMKTWEEAVFWLKNQPSQQELVRACFYDDPVGESAERYYQSTEWLEIREILKFVPKGKALDIGAGRGISAYSFAKDGWKVSALEPDKSSLVGAGAIRDLAFQANLKIDIVENWGEELPFESNTFDVVYGRQVLHHAINLKQFCKEAQRVLKPKGTFLFTREHVLSKEKDLEFFLARHPLHLLYGGENAYTLKTYKSAIVEAGLILNTTLGNFQSNINLYPHNKLDLIHKIENKIKLRIPKIFTNTVINLLSLMDHTPGRLYSFVATKK